MKAILEFNLPEETDEYENAINGSKMYSMLFDVRQELFRPFRKHGHKDLELQALFESLGDKGVEFMEKLEEKFTEIVSELDV